MSTCWEAPASTFVRWAVLDIGAAGFLPLPVDERKLDSGGALWESVRVKWESEYWKWDFPAAVGMDTPVIGMPP
ncbi:hypothetical protein C6I21_09160 [Alkalicoccus urumqiensis]|uniref:Uncharacterized protein n=1 Tax=Alkalicoccus urumqiensis TaxID=1548213 RepID=A0A2P6MHF4_ALKUR|nr:hypothetical protein C6I21_09160 [Alkalicoccus urumqiensis]